MGVPGKKKSGTDVTTPIMVVLAVVLGFFAMAILPRLLEQSHAMVGKSAPALSLPALEGAPQGGGPLGVAIGGAVSVG